MVARRNLGNGWQEVKDDAAGAADGVGYRQ